MNYTRIITQDFSNGVGCRVSLFVSGCAHQCKGCFNPESWAPTYGHPFEEIKEAFLNEFKKPFYDGISILGGDPLFIDNINDVYLLLKEFKARFPKQTVWLWTGDLYENIVQDEEKNKILNYVDVLIDGQFEIEKKDLRLKFRGSSNQRIIDVQKSLQLNQIILLEDSI